MSHEIKYVEVFEIVTKDNFDEKRYLANNDDVQKAIHDGKCKSGWAHFERHGCKENRKQQTTDFQSPINVLRKEKSQRIKQILKKDITVEQNINLVFDYTNEGMKDNFGFTDTDNVSSFFYDEMALDIVNSNPEGLILDCGAGFRPVYYQNVINFEIVAYPTTDVIGFAEDLPFEDNSLDAVFSFAVLEHVKYPFRAAEEMCRVLKPGGKIAVCAAFLQPVHAFPHHYFNMTSAGLKVLFGEKIEIERQFVNTGTGPISSLSWILNRWATSLPASERKKFRNMKVSDFIDDTSQCLNKEFVTSLSDELNFELASATLLLGNKK